MKSAPEPEPAGKTLRSALGGLSMLMGFVCLFDALSPKNADSQGALGLTAALLLGVPIIAFIRSALSAESSPTAHGTRPAPQKEIVDTDAMLAEFFAKSVYLGDHRFHRENLTIDFLRLALRGSEWCPRAGEWLRNWDSRPGVPIEVRRLRERAESEIRARLRHMQEEQEARSKADAAERATAILSRNQPRLEKFCELAYRKVATPDDYGDENPAALRSEILRFLQKLADAEPDLRRQLAGTTEKNAAWQVFSDSAYHPLASALARRADEAFRVYYSRRKAAAASEPVGAVAGMSGTDFELHLADLLKASGVTDVSTTPATGDQGGDLIFSHGGRRVVIQAKRYAGNVGNSAVQEAHAAKGFYACDEAWVVTNSQFTPAARALAKELGVVLVDEAQLADFQSFLLRRFDRPAS